LDDEKIISFLKDYLTEKTYNHAILLDGAWGSGKTYFIKKILMKDKTIARSAIYVSLYGVKSTDELMNSLTASVVEKRLADKSENGGGKSGFRILNKFAESKTFESLKNALDVLDIPWIGNASEAIKSIVSPWIKYDERYFIFDDLERCPMPINETFGFINHFVEQNDAKVLIVAYESEICASQNIDRDLIKMQIASQDSIKWPKKEERDYSGRTITKPYPDIDDIKERASMLVDEEAEYRRIKEKLIGRTIVYRPNVETTIPKICAEYFDGKIDEDLKVKLVEKICHVMEDEQHRNLRTLQSALAFYIKIHDKLPQDNASVMSIVLESVLRVSIGYKDNGYVYEITDGKPFYSIAIRGREMCFFTSGYFMTFSFIIDYVYSGSCAFDEVTNILERYCSAMQAKSTLDNLRHNLYEMEDCEITINLQNLKTELEKGSYPSEYREVLVAIFYLKRAGFDICLSEYVEIMKIKIEAGIAQVLSSFGSGERLHDDKDFFDEYKKLTGELEQITIQTQSKHKVQNLEAVLDKENGWGEDFDTYVKQHYSGTGRFDDFRHEIFAHGIPEKYKDAIERGATKECYAPIVILRDLLKVRRRHPLDIKRYFAEYENEITNLHALLEFDASSIMKGELIRYLRDDLEQVLLHINSEDESDMS
jgi:hypothetical protein